MKRRIPLWVWLLLLVFGLVFLLSFVGVFQTIFNVSSSNVSWDGVTYKCQDDVSPLSSDNQLVGCRLCAMEDLSLDGASDFIELHGIIRFGLGDCIAKTTSRGRVRFVWDGDSYSGSSFKDSDDFVGYVDAVRMKFVSWSNEYGYCPTKGLIRDEGLGACISDNSVELIFDLPSDNSSSIDLSEDSSIPLISGMVDTFSVPVWLYLVVGLLSLAIVLFIVGYNKKR